MCGRKYDAHRFGRQLLFMEYGRDNKRNYCIACCKYNLYRYGYFGWLFCHCQQHRNCYAIAYAKHQRYKYNLCRY